MSTTEKEKGDALNASPDALERVSSHKNGETDVIDPTTNQYGDAVNRKYQLKSELISYHLAENGMGK